MRLIEEQAYGVLFPVMLDLTLSETILRFLDCGGRSLLFGESADEYKSGVMSPARRAAESTEAWRRATSAARSRADGLIAALDTDISAVHRLQGLVPDLPTLRDAQTMLIDDLERHIGFVALAAADLGVNMFLSPTADVTEPGNVWLDGRTLGHNVSEVARLVSAYVRGCQRGGVASALKHFPGNPRLTAHPATDASATVPLEIGELRQYLSPFVAGISAGAEAVMMSPSLYQAANPPAAGSISKDLVQLLRGSLGFRGLVMTCDLDHPATMGDRGLPETAVLALEAGADLLLISPRGVEHIPAVVDAICGAVRGGRLDADRLRAAATALDRVAIRPAALAVHPPH